MIKKRFLLVLAGAAALLALCAVVLGFTFIANNVRTQEPLPLQPRFDGIDGLPYGQHLSMTPVEVHDDRIVFPDRTLLRYNYNIEDIEYTANMLNAAIEAIPQGVETHLMVVPPRITTEPLFSHYTDDAVAAILELYALVGDDSVVKHDVYSILNNQVGEYLYLRTNEYWTAHGSYYAAQRFLQEKEIELLPLDDFDVNRTTHNGYNYPSHPDDLLMYYILPGSTNRQTLTRRQDSGTYETYESPTVSIARGSHYVFVGSRCSHSIIRGDGENKQDLMIIGDRYSFIFAPWMIPYYQNIVLINMQWYNGDSDDFDALFKQYNIEECIFIHGVSAWGENSEIRRLNRFISVEVTDIG